MYLKNEPNIEPFDPRPGEKIHFLSKLSLSLLYTKATSCIFLSFFVYSNDKHDFEKNEISPQDVDQMVQS